MVVAVVKDQGPAKPVDRNGAVLRIVPAAGEGNGVTTAHVVADVGASIRAVGGVLPVTAQVTAHRPSRRGSWSGPPLGADH